MLYICIMHYIYTLSDPDTQEVRYIGKTNNIAKRYSAHINDKSKSHKNSWIKSLLICNKYPTITIIASFDDESKCFDAEIKYIAEYKQKGYDLTNHHNGGIGGSVETMGLDNNPRSKINSKIAISITTDLLNSDLTIEEIALKYNCTKSIVENIKVGHSWSKITGLKNDGKKWIRKNSTINRAKALREKGVYDKQSVKIQQFSLDGNLLNTFNSIKEASEKTNTNRCSISSCINNKSKTANNFIWKKLAK